MPNPKLPTLDRRAPEGRRPFAKGSRPAIGVPLASLCLLILFGIGGMVAPATSRERVDAGTQDFNAVAFIPAVYAPVTIAQPPTGTALPSLTATATIASATPTPTGGATSSPTITATPGSPTPTPPAAGTTTRPPPLVTPFPTLVSTVPPPIVPTVTPTPGSDSWHYPDRRFRLPITISANGHERQEKPAELALDFTAMLGQLGQTGLFDPDSLRVVEVADRGAAIDKATPFQFDPVAGYDAGTNARGTLVFLLKENTGANSTRRYQVYFDTTGNFTPATVAPRLALTDGVQDEGFASIRIASERQALFYHKPGGGFSSLVDNEGNDWIGWNAAGGAAGDFRGIPNMVSPKDGGYFHPGRTTSRTDIISHGPLKATFQSTSDNGQWITLWEIFPDYARLTVTKVATGFKYWFLYEGVPGGEIEASDKVVRSDGKENSAFDSWNGDLPGEEWVYITDPSLERSIFLVHDQSDFEVDTYRPQQNQMTVLGFGRDEGVGRFLTGVGRRLYFGLADATAFDEMAGIIRAVAAPLAITTGVPEKR